MPFCEQRAAPRKVPAERSGAAVNRRLLFAAVSPHQLDMSYEWLGGKKRKAPFHQSSSFLVHVSLTQHCPVWKCTDGRVHQPVFHLNGKKRFRCLSSKFRQAEAKNNTHFIAGWHTKIEKRFQSIFYIFFTDRMKETRPTHGRWRQRRCQDQSHIILERKQARISSQHPEMRLPPQPCFYKEVNISFIPLCLLPLQIVLTPRISAQLLGGVMG